MMPARVKKALATIIVLAPLTVLVLWAAGPWGAVLAVALVSAWELGKYTVRRLRAESERIDRIFDDELGPDRPDTNGEPQ